jgi:hypothetical protein
MPRHAQNVFAKSSSVGMVLRCLQFRFTNVQITATDSSAPVNIYLSCHNPQQHSHQACFQGSEPSHRSSHGDLGWGVWELSLVIQEESFTRYELDTRDRLIFGVEAQSNGDE